MMRLSEAAVAMHGELCGTDDAFQRVAIDSRGIRRGDLFVAIAGERHDGHQFIAQASQKGAIGALVSRISRSRIAQIKVDDTTAAIGQLGAHWRSQFKFPLVAVTGSNGKTTVSGLIASILNQVGCCLSPHSSFNNQWGVPLTLLRMRESHTHGVIEMGMNHPGEIEYLSGLVKPDIALINNVAAAHLSGLGSLQHIAAAKAEIFSGLKQTGTAILNADDQFYDYWLSLVKTNKIKNILRFGFGIGLGLGSSANSSEDVGVDVNSISFTSSGSQFELNLCGQSAQIQLPLLGQHNVMNAVAASAAAYSAGATLPQIKTGLESFATIKGRLNPLLGINDSLVIDDSYNANPESSKAALDVLSGFTGERIAILGGMGELGETSDELHYQVGLHARSCGIERLLCFGAPAHSGVANYARGFGQHAQCYNDLETLLHELAPTLANGSTVLVKGSRAAEMERVVASLIADSVSANYSQPAR